MDNQFDVKIGDRLWSFNYGWGEVTDIDGNIEKNPIEVEFNHNDAWFTKDFKEHKNDINQSLFWDEIKFKAPKKPLPILKVNAVLEVWFDQSVSKTIRHFSHFNTNGKPVCFISGKTSWSSIDESKEYLEWDNYKVIKEEI